MRQHEFFVGLDVGLERDFTALAVIRRGPQPGPDQLPELHVIDLQRTRGRSFVQVGQELRRLAEHLGNVGIAIDASGVGEGVWQECRRVGMRPVGVVIGSGHKITGGALRWNVPASTLYETTYRTFAAGRFRIARDLALAETLIRELQQVSAERSDRGAPVYRMPRSEEGHGDVCMSLMLASLLAEREAGRAALQHRAAAPRERTRPQGRRHRRATAEDVIEQRRRERETEAEAYARQERERFAAAGWGTGG